MKLVNNLDLFDKQEAPQNQLKKKGPPNRMNDLPYKEWMKFQKSFFWFSSIVKQTTDFICFFTKSKWEDGKESKILVVNIEKDKEANFKARSIEYKFGKSFSDLVLLLEIFSSENKLFDYVIIDLCESVKTNRDFELLNKSFKDSFFKNLRKIVIDEKYCTLIVNYNPKIICGFPLPWSIASYCRDFLRLRDEKIGINEESNVTTYFLNLQAKEDERRPCNTYINSINDKDKVNNLPAWTIPKPPPRKKNEFLHPAKYPETLVSEFIEIFTDKGDIVFDPMVGTGSTVLASIQTGRIGYGIDLSDKFIEFSKERVLGDLKLSMSEFKDLENTNLFEGFKSDRHIQIGLFEDNFSKGKAYLSKGNAGELNSVKMLEGVYFDYVCTSPPYWSMLKNPGSEGQKKRRDKNLPLVYSEDVFDVGNIEDYDKFIESLVAIYENIADRIKPKGYITIIVKNVKRNHIIYPLAWDLVAELCRKNGKYIFAGTTLWCQDDVGLKPFAVGIVWVSNTVHHYCLHMQKKYQI